MLLASQRLLPVVLHATIQQFESYVLCTRRQHNWVFYSVDMTLVKVLMLSRMVSSSHDQDNQLQQAGYLDSCRQWVFIFCIIRRAKILRCDYMSCICMVMNTIDTNRVNRFIVRCRNHEAFVYWEGDGPVRWAAGAERERFRWFQRLLISRVWVYHWEELLSFRADRTIGSLRCWLYSG